MSVTAEMFDQPSCVLRCAAPENSVAFGAICTALRSDREDASIRCSVGSLGFDLMVSICPQDIDEHPKRRLVLERQILAPDDIQFSHRVAIADLQLRSEESR